MNNFFQSVDKIKPAFDRVDKVVLFFCKILLVIDILITTYAVLGRFEIVTSILPFIKDAAWTEEVVLTCMSYMAVLAASLAIRRNSHIRMTAFDRYLPKNLVLFLDILSDVAVLVLAVIMITVGWKYATTIGGKGSYVSMPNVSKFWMYFPIPLAGFAMIIFELELLYNHVKKIFKYEEVQHD
ncbi:MAG: TRAP transporter small permease [Lachnospirales bacterium]